jgi:hypothetical protein
MEHWTAATIIWWVQQQNVHQKIRQHHKLNHIWKK